MTACAGLLLTGGTSRRLGQDKATLVIGGETLAVRTAGVLRAVCAPVLEIGPGVSGLASVREDPPGGGPLAALVAGADALAAQGFVGPVLLVAVDLPRLDPALLQLLVDTAPEADALVPVAAVRRQLCCARLSTHALVAARSALAGGERSLRALFDAVATVELPEEEWQRVAPAGTLDDLDTPADLDRLRHGDG